MNKELSHILRTKLHGLQWLDVVCGMVQAVEHENPTEDKATGGKSKRLPVTYDHNVTECQGREFAAVPDSKLRGLCYFEDGGIGGIKRVAGGVEYKSGLIFVCWLNRERITGDAYTEVTARAITAILSKLISQNPENISIFKRLSVTGKRILAQNKSVFSPYTYDDKVTQYLRPPYEFFAIELSCEYTVLNNCIAELEVIVNGAPCEPNTGGGCGDAECQSGREVYLIDTITDIELSYRGGYLEMLFNANYINLSGLDSSYIWQLTTADRAVIIAQGAAVQGTRNGIQWQGIDTDGEYILRVQNTGGGFGEVAILVSGGELVSWTNYVSSFSIGTACDNYPNYPLSYAHEVSIDGNDQNGIRGLQILDEGVVMQGTSPNNEPNVALQYNGVQATKITGLPRRIDTITITKARTQLETRTIYQTRCI